MHANPCGLRTDTERRETIPSRPDMGHTSQWMRSKTLVMRGCAHGFWGDGRGWILDFAGFECPDLGQPGSVQSQTCAQREVSPV
ncbi:MAG: hypothetical protein OHK0048_26520 [Rhodoferax sp.]